MDPNEPTIGARSRPPGDPEDVPTVDETAGGRASRTSMVSMSSMSSMSGGGSTARAGGGDSIERVRAVIDEGRVAVLRKFVGAMITTSLLALPAALLVPGAPERMQVLAMASLGALFFVYVYALKRATRTIRSGRASALNLPVAVLATGSCVGLNTAFGIFAPLPFSALIAVCIIYLSVAVSMRDATLLYVLSAIGFPIPMVLVFSGVLEDQGFFRSEAMSRQTMLLAIAGTEVALGVAYMIGRTTAKYGQHMMDRLDRAVREATRREALLREVREDLERAVGIGGPGLFTDLHLGSFVLGNVIGRGGMGEVYEAVARPSEEPVAVKLLRRDVMSDPDAVSRFEREARIAAELDSEHIVQVLEVGGLEAPLPFIAMEYLKGEDLASVLRARGRLPIAQVVELVDQVATGLEAAHERGIVHRDLKPQNLFLTRTRDGARHWKILDFGVSKLLWSADATLGAGQLVGTPTYMSPEQADGLVEVDARADLYSLMVVVYRALTGTQAFAKSSPPAVLRAVCEKMPADPADLTSMPADVRAVLRIGLAKSPDDRFSSASELAEALRLAAQEKLPEATRSLAEELTRKRPWGSSRAANVDDLSTH